MTTAIYSFYLESEVGIAAENMNPEITLVKILPDGINFPEILMEGINNTLRNLGDGVYIFSMDWDEFEGFIGTNINFLEAEFPEDVKRSLFIKIKTGFETQDQRYISLRIERQDILPDLVDEVKVAADSLTTSSEALNGAVEKILAIEEGSWIVRNNKFLVFDKNIDEVNMTDENALYSFDLKDQNGQPTDSNPFSRIASGS